VFARVFWEQPSVGFYSHEPFEVTYYEGAKLKQVARKLRSPLDLSEIIPKYDTQAGQALVIKEMPYQVGKNFPLLVHMATLPLIFLIRDPRLNIASRIAKKVEVGESPYFPLVETGWELLRKQVDYCRHLAIPYLIADATDFRNYPNSCFAQIFARFGLHFSPDILTWEAQENVVLDNLGGTHDHLYRRVLSSTGLEPATEIVPKLADFPSEQGIRAHVADCLHIYQSLREDVNRIRP
jgi:hypothetical protein